MVDTVKVINGSRSWNAFQGYTVRELFDIQVLHYGLKDDALVLLNDKPLDTDDWDVVPKTDSTVEFVPKSGDEV